MDAITHREKEEYRTMLRNDQPMLIPVDVFMGLAELRNARNWDDEYETHQEIARRVQPQIVRKPKRRED